MNASMLGTPTRQPRVGPIVRGRGRGIGRGGRMEGYGLDDHSGGWGGHGGKDGMWCGKERGRGGGGGGGGGGVVVGVNVR